MVRRRSQFDGVAFFITAVVALLGTLVVCLVAFLIQFSLSPSSNVTENAATENVLLTSAIEAEVAESESRDRAEIASRYLDTYNLLQSDSDEDQDILTLSDAQVEALGRSAISGSRLNLAVEPTDHSSSLLYGESFYSRIFLLWIYGLVFSLLYATNDVASRFIDQPWRFIWPWLFLVALGPVYWLCMIVSFFNRKSDEAYQAQFHARMTEQVEFNRVYHQAMEDGRNDVRQARDRARDFIDTIADDYDMWPEEHYLDTTPSRSATTGEPSTKKPAKVTYHSSPGVAKDTYREMRTGAAIKYRETKLNRARESLQESRQYATRLGTQLKEQQQTINSARAEITKLEASLTNKQDEASVSSIIEEFDRISVLPGVIALQSVNGGVRIIVRASHKYRDKLYDLGDWQIDLHPRDIEFNAYMVRNGLRSEWPARYPDYRLPRNRFCFGNQQHVLDEHLRKGQYLEAVSIAITSLHTVGEADKENIPKAFRVVKPQKETV